jgi:predicted aspartyl protease
MSIQGIDEVVDGLILATTKLENERCVDLLEAKANQAKDLGMNDLYDMYIVAAETIRSRD